MVMRMMLSTFLTILISSGYCAEKKHVEHAEHPDDEIVCLSDDVINRYHIKLAMAGPKIIEITRDILGKIVPNANKTIYIYPRYSGIVQKMTKFLGDEVHEGELLAKIESNQTLQSYDVTAPFSGYIVRKKANPGEFIQTGSPIYQLADLSTIWVHLFVYRDNAELIKKGQTVLVYDKSKPAKSAISQIDYVSPLGVEHSQTMMARTVLNNKTDDLIWLPGLYVNTKVVIEKKRVPVAVKNDAIQPFEGKKVVFVKTKKGFEPKACQFGLEGQNYTEVKKGLNAGDEYVAENSFILKAELEKNSTSHSH